MNFFKTSFWASISTGVTMLCGLITTKYVAMMIGPQGMAFVGQFSNSTVLIALFASAACAGGVVKYIAETTDVARQKNIIANAFFLILVCSFIVAMVTFIGAGLFSQWVFKTRSYYDIFMINAVLLVFPTLNALISSILNGLNQIRRMAILNIFIAFFNVIFILIGAHFFHIKGVLLANLVAGTITFAVNIRFFRTTGLLPDMRAIFSPDKKVIQMLLGFSMMSVVSGVIAPALQLFIRTKLLHNFDANTAGLWQANTRLSDYYLNFVYSVLAIYYLPKLSSLHQKKDIIKELKLAFVRIMPLVLVITLGIWFCRNYIVTYLLTKQFEGMLALLKWQLVGDVIKIAAWILGYVLVAKAMKKHYIIVEIGYAVASVFLNLFFINKFGLIGSVYAFCAGYTLYFLVLALILRKYFQQPDEPVAS